MLWVWCVAMIAGNVMTAYGDGMGFDVRVFPPENQRRPDSPGFDLLMEPGSEQVIEIEVGNVTQEPITLIIEIATATTDDGGTVHFRPREDVSPDSTLQYPMEEVATLEGSTFELEVDQRVRIPITIQMPEERFEGILAGGIAILQYIDEEAAAIEEGAGMIINRFWAEIPILLRQTEEPVQPELNLLAVHASQRNWRNIFAVRLQNSERMFINGMEVRAFVSRADGVETLYEQHMDHMQVAPNSNFTLAIPLGGQRFVAGYYDFHMEVTAQNGSWSFLERFYVSPEEAEALNATDVSISRTPLWMFVAAGGALVAILLLVYMILFRRKSKRTTDVALEKLMSQLNRE